MQIIGEGGVVRTVKVVDGVEIVSTIDENSIDRVRVERVAWGDYCVLFEIEIFTREVCDGGEYGYAIFDVFHIYDLTELEHAEEEIGEYKGFVLLGRVPYLLEIKPLPDGGVEEVYHIPIFGRIPKRHLEKREFTKSLKYNNLDLRIRRIATNKPYTKKQVLVISLDEEGEFMNAEKNFIFVYNEGDKVLLEGLKRSLS